MADDTVFGKIIRKEIPCKFVYQDDKCIVIDEIDPQGPVHFLVIPCEFIPMLEDAGGRHEGLLGHLLLIASKVAKEKGLNSGYRVVINNGVQAAQSVYHLSVHVIGGRAMQWPPG